MPRSSQAFVVREEDCALESSEANAFGPARWRTLISGDRAPTDSLTVGVAEIDPGKSGQFRPHRHAQKEVYYILSGEGKVVISGTEYVVGPRTAVFIPGGAEHCAVNTGSEPLRLLYVFPADSFADVNYEFTSS